MAHGGCDGVSDLGEGGKGERGKGVYGRMFCLGGCGQ